MKAKIKITQAVVDRLKLCKYEQSGALYGVIHKDTQYIIGLFNTDDYSYADLLFPANIDMCGAYQIGPINKDEVNQILMDVDVTDNPIFISIPEANEILAYHVINNKIENAEMIIIHESEVYSEFMHIRLEAPILLQSEVDVESVNEELLIIRKQISSGKLAFHCEKYKMFILSENNIVNSMEFNEETPIRKIRDNHKKHGEIEYSRKFEDNELEVLPFTMMKKSTIEKGDNSSNLHAPIIQIEQNEAKMLSILLQIDAISLVHEETTLSKLYTILVESACRNLKLIGNYIMDVMTEMDNTLPISFQPEILHFFPSRCGHFISRILNKHDQDEENIRMLLHKNFLLNMHRPVFRRGNAFHFKTDGNEQSRIMNPHADLNQPSGGGEIATVSGNYYYYHYKQDGLDDDGWGCAYRSLQTLASWLLLQGYTDKQVPSFKQIQQCLYDIGDKPSSFVGSRQWIGSTEVNFVLESLLGISCRIINVSSGEELASKGPDLIYHFQTYGSPVMIGGGVLAHTILGVNYNRDTGEIKFLILDPHYTGADNLRTIISKGWCGWKNLNFWDKKAYYNMCLPIVQTCL